MLPKYHIILGAIFSVSVYLLLSTTFLQTLIIFLASFLIDFDHYIYCIFKYKLFNPVNCFKYLSKRRKKYFQISEEDRRKKYKNQVFIFHGIEFFTILSLLSFINGIFTWIFVGALFHIFLDLIDLAYQHEPFYSKLSFILVILKNKGKIDFL